jgi:hypothetical protein
MKQERYVLPQIATGLGLTKDVISQKKKLFFEWLEAPKSSRIPKYVKEVEHYLKISHPTSCKWKKEYENGVRVRDKIARVAVTSEDVTSLLVKKLEQFTPALMDGIKVDDDPKKGVTDMVQLGMWLNMSRAVDKMSILIGKVEDASQMLTIMERLTGVLKRVDDVASGAATRIGREVQSNKVTQSFGVLVQGINLPDGSQQRREPIDITPNKSKAIAPPVDEDDGEGEEVPETEDAEEPMEDEQDLASVGFAS